MVRAKFICEKVEKSGEGTEHEQDDVSLRAVYEGSEENKEFFKYTPAGSIVLGTVNPAAAAQFTVGAEYYVDFTPAA